MRKIDPGEKFPWDFLHRAGVGHWVEPAPMAGEALSPGARGQDVMLLQKRLAAYGYGLRPSGFYDHDTTMVVTAFQRHFRPALAVGVADHSTVQTLNALSAARPQRLVA